MLTELLKSIQQREIKRINIQLTQLPYTVNAKKKRRQCWRAGRVEWCRKSCRLSCKDEFSEDMTFKFLQTLMVYF